MARTTPVRLGLCSLVTLLALPLSLDGQLPVPVTAWYHKADPTFSDGLALYANIAGMRGIWGTLRQQQSAYHCLKRL